MKLTAVLVVVFFYLHWTGCYGEYAGLAPEVSEESMKPLEGWVDFLLQSHTMNMDSDHWIVSCWQQLLLQEGQALILT